MTGQSKSSLTLILESEVEKRDGGEDKDGDGREVHTDGLQFS